MWESPKRLWSYLKSRKQDTSGVAPLKHSDGFLHNDAATKAEILNTQFHSMYTREDLTHIPDQGVSPHPTMPDIRIDQRGLHKLLKGLKPHKATGPDMVPARLLRDFASEFSIILSRLFQTSLNDGKIPSDWRKASIVIIYKKGDKHKASNYRPVSLTSAARTHHPQQHHGSL